LIQGIGVGGEWGGSVLQQRRQDDLLWLPLQDFEHRDALDPLLVAGQVAEPEHRTIRQKQPARRARRLPVAGRQPTRFSRSQD
jgi:hypothetical protein